MSIVINELTKTCAGAKVLIDTGKSYRHLMKEQLKREEKITYETDEGIVHCSTCGAALNKAEIENEFCNHCNQVENS